MSDVYIHMPASLFARQVDYLLSRKLSPEIACQDTDISRIDMEEVADAAARLSEAGLTTLLHAPFVGFQPGAKDPASRRRTIEILEHSLILAERISARKIVFHPGLEPNISRRQSEMWLERSYTLWSDYIGWAQSTDCTFCIENIYESSPDLLLSLMSAVDSPCFGHVFDIGHWNIFSANRLTLWLDQIAAFLRHLHLHDNRGFMDEHLAIGAGSVPFDDLFNWLAANEVSPSITVENHNIQALNQSLAALDDRWNDRQKKAPGNRCPLKNV